MGLNPLVSFYAASDRCQPAFFLTRVAVGISFLGGASYFLSLAQEMKYKFCKECCPLFCPYSNWSRVGILVRPVLAGFCTKALLSVTSG